MPLAWINIIKAKFPTKNYMIAISVFLFKIFELEKQRIMPFLGANCRAGFLWISEIYRSAVLRNNLFTSDFGSGDSELQLVLRHTSTSSSKISLSNTHVA